MSVGQTIYPVNRKGRGKKGARDKVAKRRGGKEGLEQGRKPRDP